MDLTKLSKPLEIDEVEFRVQSINKGGYATILVYKDARADMARLDEAVGVLGWKREHVNNNANCIVSIWNADTNQWISKEDTGTESQAEAKKGLASDSFKRACFNWGIGRELYDYPVIKIKLKDKEYDKATNKPTWDFKLKEWSWISEFKDGKIIHLSSMDNLGNSRFNWKSHATELKQPEAPPANTKPMFTSVNFKKAQEAGATLEVIKTKYTVQSQVEAAYIKYCEENK
jgi:hypothetical protein